MDIPVFIPLAHPTLGGDVDLGIGKIPDDVGIEFLNNGAKVNDRRIPPNLGNVKKVQVGGQVVDADTDTRPWLEYVLPVCYNRRCSIVAHRLGKTCVVGCANLVCMERQRACSLNQEFLKSGDWVSIDGLEGSVYSGQMKIKEMEKG